MSFVDEANGATTAIPDAPSKWSRGQSSNADWNERSG
jgi:hypothetical protein